MILVVIGFLAALFACTWSDDGWKFILWLLAGAICLAAGICLPIHGYEEPVLQAEYELFSIPEYKDVYAIKDSDGSVTCIHENKSNNEKMYTYEKNIELVYEEGAKPILQKYSLKPKTSVIAMALKCTKEKYVITCPQSNIKIWQNKHVE